MNGCITYCFCNQCETSTDKENDMFFTFARCAAFTTNSNINDQICNIPAVQQKKGIETHDD